MITEFFILLHEVYSDDPWDPCNGTEMVMGIYDTENRALDARHKSLKAFNKDGTISHRKGDPRPKIMTLDGCDRIYRYELNKTLGANEEPEYIKQPEEVY